MIIDTGGLFKLQSGDLEGVGKGRVYPTHQRCTGTRTDQTGRLRAGQRYTDKRDLVVLETPTVRRRTMRDTGLVRE